MIFSHIRVSNLETNINVFKTLQTNYLIQSNLNRFPLQN